MRYFFVSCCFGDIVIAVPVIPALNKSLEFTDCYFLVLKGCPVSFCAKQYCFVFYTLTSQFLKQDGNPR